MSAVADILEANRQALVRRWRALLAAGPRGQEGALARLAAGELGQGCAALFSYLRTGDAGTLRRYCVGLVGSTPRFRLASTQRNFLAFRQAALETLTEASEGTSGEEAARAIEQATEQAIFSLADVYQSAVADHEREQTNRIYELEEKLAATSVRDAATGVFNRGFFRERLTSEWRISTRYERPLSLLVVGVDGLEALNAVDEGRLTNPVLRALANVLVSSSRAADLVARVGNDRFALILPETDGIGASQLAERLRTVTRNLASEVRPPDWPLRLSMGVADRREDVRGAEALLRRAEIALMRARQAGGDQCYWAGATE